MKKSPQQAEGGTLKDNLTNKETHHKPTCPNPKPTQQMLVYVRFETQPTNLFITRLKLKKKKLLWNPQSYQMIWVKYNRRAQFRFFS